MKNIQIYQELIVFTNTHFSARGWSLKEDDTKDKELPPKERLKNACWNGLIPELLPEVCEKTYDPSLTLWEVFEADNFLELVFGDDFQKSENFFSINPYQILDGKEYN